MTTSKSSARPLHLHRNRTSHTEVGYKDSILSKVSDVFSVIGLSLRRLSDRLSIATVPIIISLVAFLMLLTTLFLNRELRVRIQQESIIPGQRLSSFLASAISLADIESAKIRNQALKEQAEKVEEKLLDSTRRELLSYRFFPKPKDSSTFIFEDFANTFCRKVDDTLKDLAACQPPSRDLIEQTLDEVIGQSTRVAVQTDINPYRFSAGKIEQKVIDAICDERAMSGSIYIDPLDIAGYQFWHDYEYKGTEQSLTDSWYGQIGYWIVEDVLNTIDRLNHGSEHIRTSPVKRLLGIYFERPQDTYRTSSRLYENYAEMSVSTVPHSLPDYVYKTSAGLVPSLTNRTCDDQLDVVHFGVEVVVEANEVLTFMKELNSAKTHRFQGFSGQEPERILKHNQITILNSEILPVVRSDSRHRFCRYGDSAVVHLKLICEYIFIKEAYDTIKPESVKSEFLNNE